MSESRDRAGRIGGGLLGSILELLLGKDRERSVPIWVRVVVFVVLGVASLVLFRMSFGAEFPDGYWKWGREVVKQQQRVYGLAHWSSLMLAQVEQESGWRRCPTSIAGARGLTQFIPSTQVAVESASGFFGDICDPLHAARLQAWLMRDNAVWCGARTSGWLSVWACALRTYNGSRRSWEREWVACGSPTNTFDAESCRVRSVEHHRENVEYVHRIVARWPKYWWRYAQ